MRQGRLRGTAGGGFQDPAVVRALLSDVRFAWLWLVPRVGLGWLWLEAGWQRSQGSSDAAGDGHRLTEAVAVGQTLAGIALILGVLTGLAALAGARLGADLPTSDAVWTTPLVAVAVGLVLAWKTAGWIGLDRWLLPALGMPWRGGALFGGASSEPDREWGRLAARRESAPEPRTTERQGTDR